MSVLEKRPVGCTDIQVPIFGLGGASLGNLYTVVPESDALKTIQTALAAGVNYLDTAPLYGHGLSERRFGAALAGIPRETYTLSTKVGYRLDPVETPPKSGFAAPDAYAVAFDYSRDAVLRSLEGSRKRLGIDRIDIVYIHDPDEGVTMAGKAPYAASHFRQAMDEAYPVLDDLRSQGVISAIGVGINQWQMLVDFARAGDFDCFLLAGRYTLLEQESLDVLLPLCEEKAISIIIGGPYNSGILAAPPGTPLYYNYQPASPEIIQRVTALQAVCARHGVPLQAAALQFPLAHPAVTAVIPGSRSVAEFQQNLAYLQHPIPPYFWADLKNRGLLHPDAPVGT